MRRIAFFVLCAVTLACNNLLAQNNEPSALLYLCEDNAPANYLENGEVRGFSVDLLKLIWEKMGVVPQKIKVVPWARGYESVKTEPNTVLFSMTRTKEREDMFKWVGPIFTVKGIFLGLASSKINITRVDDAKKYKIGTIREDVIEQVLLGKGFNKSSIETVSNMEQNFEKLKIGRIDLIAYARNSLFDHIKKTGDSPDKYRVYFVFSEQRNYYAFHRATSNSVVQKFQNALDSNASIHKNILAKYNLDL